MYKIRASGHKITLIGHYKHPIPSVYDFVCRPIEPNYIYIYYKNIKTFMKRICRHQCVHCPSSSTDRILTQTSISPQSSDDFPNLQKSTSLFCLCAIKKFFYPWSAKLTWYPGVCVKIFFRNFKKSAFIKNILLFDAFTFYYNL